MTKIINNTVTFIGAVVGLIGGSIWGYNTDFDYEPIILISISMVTVVGFIVSRLYGSSFTKEDMASSKNNANTKSRQNLENVSTQNVELNVNIGEPSLKHSPNSVINSEERNTIIEAQKPKTHILFIDDDTKFKTVKMFKDSGWQNTRTVKDVKSIDLPVVQNADIVFVDINGVGKLLDLEYEGLDLAYMIKQKYPQKKVVIYSAKKDSNSFHKAWDIIDDRIEKNALPIQFQNVADNYCLSKANIS